MSVERNLTMSVLKLTREGSVSQKLVNRNARIPTDVGEKLLEKLQNDGLLYVREDAIEADDVQRLRLALQALQLGADLQSVSDFLHWKEFEGMAAVALTRNDFKVQRNLRFSQGERRWEIDVVGCKKPLAVCIDCKHWHHGMHPSALKKAVEEQVQRTSAFAKHLPSMPGKVECASWNRVNVVPVVLSLFAGKLRFHDDVPVVSVHQLQDFIGQLPVFASSLKHFLISRHDFQDRLP